MLLISRWLPLLYSIVIGIKTFNEYAFEVLINELRFLWWKWSRTGRRGRMFLEIFLSLNLFLFRNIYLFRVWLRYLYFPLWPSSTPCSSLFSFFLRCLLNIQLLEIFPSSCPSLPNRLILRSLCYTFRISFRVWLRLYLDKLLQFRWLKWLQGILYLLLLIHFPPFLFFLLMLTCILPFEIDEIINDIDQIRNGLPGIIFLFISLPFDEILTGSTFDSHIKNLLAEIRIVPLRSFSCFEHLYIFSIRGGIFMSSLLIKIE